MPLLYNLVYPFARAVGWALRLWVNWEVVGAENVPRKGGLIAVANHVNVADILLLVVCLGRKGCFMAKEELFRSRLSAFFLRNLATFPVHRDKIDLEAMRTAYDILAKGGMLIIFPEGTRSREGQMKPALSGAAQIAVRSGAPLLPVGIAGTENVHGMKSVLTRPKVVVTIGKSFHLPSDSRRSTKEKRAEMTRLIMLHIAELLPPEYRGAYSAEKVPYEG